MLNDKKMNFDNNSKKQEKDDATSNENKNDYDNSQSSSDNNEYSNQSFNRENKNDIDSKVRDLAKKLGIEDILQKFPYEVSGGQKQRCACARALICNPKLILADEPTGALDSKSSKMLLETMNELNEKLKATILMVTHDTFSASFCKRVLFLKDGKLFNEILRENKSRKEFFNEILDVLTLLGGDVENVK